MWRWMKTRLGALCPLSTMTTRPISPICLQAKHKISKRVYMWIVRSCSPMLFSCTKHIWTLQSHTTHNNNFLILALRFIWMWGNWNARGRKSVHMHEYAFCHSLITAKLYVARNHHFFFSLSLSDILTISTTNAWATIFINEPIQAFFLFLLRFISLEVEINANLRVRAFCFGLSENFKRIQATADRKCHVYIDMSPQPIERKEKKTSTCEYLMQIEIIDMMPFGKMQFKCLNNVQHQSMHAMQI